MNLVLRALSMIEKDEREVVDVGFASPHLGDGEASQFESFPFARIEGKDRPEPLSNLGEGMNRAFALAIGLIRAPNGVLLVDEVENGLHYSVQADLWRLIFETAEKFDVQVFATTHSYDYVQAFEQVAQDYESLESMLVSLRRREEDPEDIVAVLSDRDELGTVVEENIEVR